MDTLLPRFRRLEGTKQLGGASAQGPDKRAVVLVGNLAGTVVEFELLQRSERTVALLLERNPLLFPRPRLLEAVVLGNRFPQEGACHEQDAPHGKQGAQDEPDAHYAFLGEYFDGHFVTRESRFATKTPFA
jgi:hypothetical protein